MTTFSVRSAPGCSAATNGITLFIMCGRRCNCCMCIVPQFIVIWDQWVIVICVIVIWDQIHNLFVL